MPIVDPSKAVRRTNATEKPPRDRWDICVKLAKAVTALAVMIATLVRNL